MISYEYFETAMMRIKHKFDTYQTIYEASNRGIDLFEVTDCGCGDLALMLLAKLLNDKEDWISYWVYELDWGQRYEDRCCTEKDGAIINIATMQDLYDYIVKVAAE